MGCGPWDFPWGHACASGVRMACRPTRAFPGNRRSHCSRYVEPTSLSRRHRRMQSNPSSRRAPQVSGSWSIRFRTRSFKLNVRSMAPPLPSLSPPAATACCPPHWRAWPRLADRRVRPPLSWTQASKANQTRRQSLLRPVTACRNWVPMRTAIITCCIGIIG